MLIKHKKIFECFSCFWKVFCFCKKFQKFQKHCYPVLATQSRVGLVAYPNCEPTQRFFVAYWRVNVPVTKILRIFFKILGLYVSRGSIWRLVHGWKVQLQGVHRDFRGSPRDFLTSRLSSGEKHLEKFSNFWFLGFSRLVLTTCTRLGSVAKIACFAYWGLFSRSFSNTFHFSLMHHYHCSYLHLLPSFLIDPFVYSCQKRGKVFYFLCTFVGEEIHYTCPFITCYTLRV